MNGVTKSLDEIKEEFQELGNRLDRNLEADRAVIWLWANVCDLVDYLQSQEAEKKGGDT